jgi:hypothetical protein
MKERREILRPFALQSQTTTKRNIKQKSSQFRKWASSKLRFNQLGKRISALTIFIFFFFVATPQIRARNNKKEKKSNFENSTAVAVQSRFHQKIAPKHQNLMYDIRIRACTSR